ncbi:hypothetical protein NLJ89_g6727 [Agrocybe chaxingu]|uniref:Arylamine N-acetyltransferase n=1 Tax=Agrocybe chaxingu TaxID=84603 RepID=A0A9W8K5V5_9AGAR|nr:hypothetical protein NLJ89_g6727 [Agrocybe chaxingu]
MPAEIRRGILQGGAWIKKVPSYYMSTQAAQFLACMGLDLGIDENDIASGSAPTSVESLALIVKHFLLSFPWENTVMHYTPNHLMDVTPEGIFKRMVTEKKGGSYCFGMNGLLFGMLRALGYRAYSGAARVNEGFPGGPLEYSTLSHHIIFVQPEAGSNRTYVVDVGFGSGLMRPMLLSNEEDNVIFGLNSFEKHRLTRKSTPSSNISASIETSPSSGVPTEIKWNLEALHQQKDNRDVAWRVLYSFTEDEFHLKDFQAASFAVSMMPVPRGLFWSNVVCTKTFVLKGDHADNGMSDASIRSGEEMYRLVIVGKEVKKHIGGETEIIKILDTELERVRALRESFGIDLREDDVVHIVGRASALG